MINSIDSVIESLDKTQSSKGALSYFENNFSNMLIETAPVMILMLNPQGKIILFNNFMEKLTGYSVEEVKGADWFEIFIPEPHRKKTKKLFLSAINDNRTYANVDLLLTKGGTQKSIEWYDRTMKDSKGNLLGLLCIGLDITQRRRAENELFQTLEKYQELSFIVNNSPAVAFLWQASEGWPVKYVSENIRQFGYTPEDFYSGRVPFASIIHPDDIERVAAEVTSFSSDPQCKEFAQEYRILSPEGKVFTLDDRTWIQRNEHGEITHYQGIIFDISDKKHAEQTLIESEERFRSIASSAQDAIVMMDSEGNISYWNEAAQDIFGYSAKEVTGRSLHDILAPTRFLEDFHKGFSHFKKTGEGAVVGKTVELAALRKDGSEFPIELSLSKTMTNGKWHATGIIRDITERKKMQDELHLKDEMMIVQSKQAAMGEMMAMLAHQWRQPIAVISMAINNLQASLELGEDITKDDLIEHTTMLYKQVKQLDSTIENFRNFFKPSQGEEVTTITDVLNSTLEIIGKSLENNEISINLEYCEDVPILINKSSLTQVLLNILGNAKNALVKREIENPVINIKVTSNDKKTTISICDNAGGIPEDIINKLSQPYFTTKDEFNGAGLGLYTSRMILEKHLFGTLAWQNKTDGACFYVTLKNRSSSG